MFKIITLFIIFSAKFLVFVPSVNGRHRYINCQYATQNAVIRVCRANYSEEFIESLNLHFDYHAQNEVFNCLVIQEVNIETWPSYDSNSYASEIGYHLIIRQTTIHVLNDNTSEYKNDYESVEMVDTNIGDFTMNSALPFPYLKILQLWHNNLRKIGSVFLSKLSQLREINLSFNQFREIDLEIFANKKYLSKIDLSNNNLFMLHGSIPNDSNVEFLFLQNNKIREFDAANFALKTLNINNNSLNQLNFHQQMVNMTAAYNNISQLQCLKCGSGCVVADLNLTSNRLKDISCISEFTQLERADLSNNSKIQINSNTLKSLTKLEYLNLHSVNLSEITNETFRYPVKLLHLDLSYNQLEHVDLSVFHTLRNLEELYLDGNRLKNIIYHDETMYKLLYLREMGISNTSMTCNTYDAFVKHFTSHYVNFPKVYPFGVVYRDMVQCTIEISTTTTTITPPPLQNWRRTDSHEFEYDEYLDSVNSEETIPKHWAHPIGDHITTTSTTSPPTKRDHTHQINLSHSQDHKSFAAYIRLTIIMFISLFILISISLIVMFYFLKRKVFKSDETEMI